MELQQEPFVIYLILRLLIDCSAVIDPKTVFKVIFHIKRLCYALHTDRYMSFLWCRVEKEIEKTLKLLKSCPCIMEAVVHRSLKTFQRL